MGLKANCLEIGNAAFSYEDEFDIDAGALTSATRANFEVLKLNNGKCIVFYTGSGALTLSELDKFPVGTVIFDLVNAKKIHFHNTASTWVSSAALS